MLRSKNVRQCFRQYVCRYVRCFYIIMYVCLLCVNHVCQYACLNVRQYLRQYECQCLFQRSGVGTMRTEISIPYVRLKAATALSRFTNLSNPVDSLAPPQSSAAAQQRSRSDPKHTHTHVDTHVRTNVNNQVT